ncbi:MAG: translation initiation factor IF-3, partial [Pseudomonadota bacterium]
MRRPFRAPPPQKSGPPANRDIREPEVQLITADGDNQGVIDTRDALRMAEEASLDLVLISPNAKP